MKLPSAIKTKWLKALRSGEYKQATGTLYKAKTDGYCCLGVLQKIVSGQVECSAPDKCWDAGSNKPLPQPTLAWYIANGIEVDKLNVNAIQFPYLSDDKISKLMDLNDGQEDYDADLNEDGSYPHINQHSFLEIADYIEANIETIDP